MSLCAKFEGCRSNGSSDITYQRLTLTLFLQVTQNKYSYWSCNLGSVCKVWRMLVIRLMSDHLHKNSCLNDVSLSLIILSCEHQNRIIHPANQNTPPPPSQFEPKQLAKCCTKIHTLFKEALIEPVMLAYPQVDGGMFVLDTDVSGTAIGAMLSQVQEGEERVLSYGSRCLSSMERNYCTTRRSCWRLSTS